MRKKTPLFWDENFYQRSHVFDDIKLLLWQKDCADWPNGELLDDFFSSPCINANAKKICFRPPNPSLNLSYEERVFLTGEVETRAENWHDFFNACIWGLFPLTKLLLNQLHIDEIKVQTGSLRSIKRDAITHLDESGIVVASSNAQLLADLRQHRWLEVFYQQRECWQHQITAFVFGHGMYEKALKPFIGFTGKMYPILVDEAFFAQTKQQQYLHLDQLLCQDIQTSQTLNNNQYFSPLPILGVSGWHDENTQADFYANTDYFRPKNT